MRERILTFAGAALLFVGALVDPARPAVAVLLVLGWLGLRAFGRPAAIGWAAVLPVALLMSWPWILGADAPLGDPACEAPLSVIAVRRAILSLAGLAVVAGLARAHASGRVELGLRQPSAGEASLALAGVLILAVGGLVIGPWIARPFFGELDFPRPAAALVPAILFGVANGVLEEVAYRGAMQAWLARTMPLAVAIGLQGLAFGIVHAGPEVVALLPVHIALLAAVGVAGGIARARLGSLWIPIGVHVGADIALYVGLACRAAG
jgi:membrane protease YdiL (CAAX protease family)